jgi:hypothetical protein
MSATTGSALLKEALAGSDRIVSVDMHTGLGPSGYGEIISNAVPGTPGHDALERIWPGDTKTTADGSSVSADLAGTMDDGLRKLLAPSHIVPVALEFGTEDPMTVFRATQASSWLHVYGDPAGPEAETIRLQSRRAFYTETDAWKNAIWDRSVDVIGKAARSLLA